MKNDSYHQILLVKEHNSPKCKIWTILLVFSLCLFGRSYFEDSESFEAGVGVAECPYDSCKACQEANFRSVSRRNLAFGFCSKCCKDFRSLPPEISDIQLHEVAQTPRLSESPGPSQTLRANEFVFPLTNLAIQNSNIDSHLHLVLRRIEKSFSPSLISAINFLKCVERNYEYKTDLYPRCYLFDGLTHEETWEEYTSALVGIGARYSHLHHKFPRVIFQYMDDFIPFFSPDLKNSLESIRKKHTEQEMSWLVFEMATVPPPDLFYSYRFSVRFKKRIPREDWLNVVFAFAEYSPHIEWFKIAPINPDGRDDAVFAFMQEYDADQMKYRAKMICEFWTLPEVDSMLSKDLPAFQYNKLCTNGKVSWTAYVNGISHGMTLSFAFAYDVREVLSNPAFSDYLIKSFPKEYTPCFETIPGSLLSPIQNPKAYRSCLLLTTDAWVFCKRPVEDFWEGLKPLHSFEDFSLCVRDLLLKHFSEFSKQIHLNIEGLSLEPGSSTQNEPF